MVAQKHIKILLLLVRQKMLSKAEVKLSNIVDSVYIVNFRSVKVTRTKKSWARTVT